MEDNNLADETACTDPSGNSEAVTSRPTTLNILLDNCLKSPLLPSSLTPSLEELPPLIKSEVEKILQQLRSPQTPGSFLNPGHLPEDQERLANLFSQKLSELQDSNDLATLTAALSPAVANNGLYNVAFPDLGPQHISGIAELCRQANQARLATSPASIFLYSPTTFDPQSLAGAHTVNSGGSIAYQHNPLDGSNITSDPVNALNQLQGSLSLSIPNGSLSSDREVTTVQLPNGLRFGISTNLANPQTNVFQILGLESPTDLISNIPVSQQSDPTRWSQTNAQSDTSLNETFQSSDSISRELMDTRPDSVDNDGLRPAQSPSVSSVSSSSQANSSSRKTVTSPNLQDTRLDPNEQSRMRLERKRARNRDAARKCRERKIRLIKNLEKDVFHLSEENKALRNRLSISRCEVERLKLFVVNHLEKDCPALSGKVA